MSPKTLLPQRPAIALVVVMITLIACGSTTGHRDRPSPSVASPADVPVARERWRWDSPPGGSVGMPTVDVAAERMDQVAFTYGHIAVVLVDGNGHELWQSRRVGVRDVAPTVTDRLVLAATDEGVAAFDRTDGHVVWDTDLGDRANTPVVVAGKAVTSTWDGSLVGIDIASGGVGWSVALPGPAFAPAAGDGESTVVASWDLGSSAGVVAVSVPDGRVRWSAPVAGGGVSGPAITTATPHRRPGALVVAGDRGVHLLALDDGHEEWAIPLEGAGSPEVVPWVGREADEPVAVVGHRLGGFVVVDLADGAALWSASSDGAAVRGGPVASSFATAVGPRVSTTGATTGGTRRRSAGATPAVTAAAMPLDDGRVLVAGDGWTRELRPAAGRIGGLAVLGDGSLAVSTRGPQPAALVVLSGWASSSSRGSGWAPPGATLRRGPPSADKVASPGGLVALRPASSRTHGRPFTGVAPRFSQPMGREHHGRSHDEAAAGGGRPLRAPDPALEPEDEAVHLR